MKNSQAKYAVFASFTTMLVMAMSYAIRGMLVPTFKEVFTIGNSEIGWLISTTTIVTMLFSYGGSMMCMRYGQKPILIIGTLVSGLSYYLTSFANSYTALFVGYIGITIGAASVIIAMNTMIPLLQIQAQTLIMNLLHFFFGFGVTLSQSVSGYLLSIGTHWRMLFVISAALYVVNLLIILPMRGPSGTGKVRKGKSTPIPHKGMLAFIILAIGFYVSAELQTGNWFVNYLKDTYGYAESTAASFSAMFFGCFALGRLLGGFISQKYGPFKCVLISISIAVTLYTAGLMLGEPGLYLVSFSGAFFGLIYPTMLVVTASLYPNTSVKVIGILSTITNLVTFITGLLMGYMNDWIGTSLTFWMIPGFLLASLSLFLVVAKYMKQPEISEIIEKAAQSA